ncbi:MAG: hypothetical protein M9959_15830 [Chitinophagaceae bacterium]|nr:hypothetical protein [Chitinophagaceae bacterium]
MSGRITLQPDGDVSNLKEVGREVKRYWNISPRVVENNMYVLNILK